MFLSSGSYSTYVSVIGSLIFPLRKPTPEFLSFVLRSGKMQDDVFNMFANVFTNSLFEPKEVPLGKMPLHVRRLTAGDWQRPLRIVYDIDPLIDRNAS